MLFTNLTVPPSIRGTPNLLQNTPKTAYGCDTIMSHQQASSSPPATAYPSTAAMTGLESVILDGPIGPLPLCDVLQLSAVLILDSIASARSKPAQKVLSPYRMAISLVADSSNFLKAATSCSAVGVFTQFLTSGRLILTIVILPPKISYTITGGLKSAINNL